MRCSVHNCSNDTKNTSKSHGITFHLFPKEPSLREAWLEALSLAAWEPKERSAVCSEHFRNEDFYQTKTGLRKIKNGAVPVVALDPAEDLEAPATHQVCRVCLAMDARMYDIREHRLDQFYEQITGMFFGIEDRLPQRLCWECAHRLKSASVFRSKALKAHTILADMLCSSTFITIRDIKSVNRIHNNLKSNLRIKSLCESSGYNILIRDNEIIKSESHNHNEYNDNGYNHNENVNGIEYTDNEHNGYNDDDRLNNGELEVEVKNETQNEIYFDEFVDNFESDDDKKLSEIYSDVSDKKKAKVKKKKAGEKKRVVKKRKENSGGVKKQEEGEGFSTVVDKYKINEIKRRKNDGPDENLFTVTALTYDEQRAEIEKRQEGAMYRNSLFKCTYCFMGFHVKERYEVHMVRHSELSGAFQCFICKTRLKTSRALRKHLTAQHTEKFSCKGCTFVTRNRGVAREHEKWHSGTKYQCPHCPSTFEKLTTYMGHIRIKHVSDFVCELCGYTFVSQKGIEVHKKKKHRLHDRNVELSGPFCEVCNVKFVSEEAHSRHLKLSARHSSDADPNRIRNDSQSMRAEHGPRGARRAERRAPPAGRAGPAAGHVTCEQCGVQLRDLRLYAQHFRRAHPDKNRTKYPAMKTPCMCEQCGRIFQSMALLKDHMWVHTGEKRFKCAQCPKSFTQKTNLVFHERVHSASRPTYECALCGKHFAFYNNRRRHMFIHTGLKPYKCATCGKCFTTAGEQRAHVTHVHLKKPWPRRRRGPTDLAPCD